MLSKVNSAGLSGMHGYSVSVQVDESNVLPKSVIVGNVSASVREAQERVFVALKNIGYALPPKRLTINLAPADQRKEGTYFDLPIVTGMLRSLRMLPDFPIDEYGFLGEVGLDGQVRHVRGMLSLITEFKKQGRSGAVIPLEDVQEALAVDDMDIIGISSLQELIALLHSEEDFFGFPRETMHDARTAETYDVDFSEIHGQSYAVRASLIAAAGGHNLLLSGVAGSGKTMIAKRLPTILPALTREENIEITKIYSIAGLLPRGEALMNRRPFRTPHHTITTPALIGGALQGGIVPGELVLSSGGVLFLDELPLFSKSSIEALRQPIEEKKVIINRLNGSFTYPAECLLVAAMNPCPCGYYPDRNKCRCTPGQIRSYQRGVSKPILERIDLCAEASPVSYQEATDRSHATDSASLRKKVNAARKIQKIRFRSVPGVKVNAGMGIREIEEFCVLHREEENFIRKIFELKSLSMRTYHKVLKVARTIADLENEKDIRVQHLSEAVSYRGLEERLYGGEIG